MDRRLQHLLLALKSPAGHHPMGPQCKDMPGASASSVLRFLQSSDMVDLHSLAVLKEELDQEGNLREVDRLSSLGRCPYCCPGLVPAAK